MKAFLCVCAILSAATLAMADTSLEVQGDYVEVRSNEVYTCGCLYSGEMVTGGREAILTWDFSQQSQPTAVLEDIRVAAVVFGATSLSLADSPRKAVVYLDGVKSREQQEAVLSWFRERHHEVLGEIIRVRQERIELDKSPENWTMKVGEDLRLTVRTTQLPQDAHLGSQRWYDPFVPLKESRLSTVLYDEYSDDELRIQWRHQRERIAGFTGQFSVPWPNPEQ